MPGRSVLGRDQGLTQTHVQNSPPRRTDVRGSTGRTLCRTRSGKCRYREASSARIYRTLVNISTHSLWSCSASRQDRVAVLVRFPQRILSTFQRIDTHSPVPNVFPHGWDLSAVPRATMERLPPLSRCL